MGAKRRARKEFEKEQELEKLRAKSERKQEIARIAQEKEAAKIAAMTPEEKEVYLRKQARNRKVTIAIVLLAFAFLVIAGFSGSSEDTGTTTPSTNASFSGEIISSKVINLATVNVVFKISNTGTDPGTPNCMVRVQDASGTYRGYDSPIFDYPIEPNSSITGNINLTVTKEGALFVTEGEVTCS